MFHGQEGEPAVREKFNDFLRQIDSFLQVLTLGISATKPQDETITTARYRELPAIDIDLSLVGVGTSEPSFLLY